MLLRSIYRTGNKTMYFLKSVGWISGSLKLQIAIIVRRHARLKRSDKIELHPVGDHCGSGNDAGDRKSPRVPRPSQGRDCYKNVTESFSHWLRDLVDFWKVILNGNKRSHYVERN